MDELAARFEEHRIHLRTVAHRMLGSLSEADDAVQETLHDMFAVPYGEIAPMLDRSPAATRQLASRARRRVREAAPVPDADLPRQRAVVEAFFDAGRAGDFDRLVGLLHPDVVLRGDGADGAVLLRGRDAVGRQARWYAGTGREVRPARVQGAAGVVVAAAGRPVAVLGFTVRDGLIVAIDAVSDPARLASLDLGAVG